MEREKLDLLKNYFIKRNNDYLANTIKALFFERNIYDSLIC